MPRCWTRRSLRLLKSSKYVEEDQFRSFSLTHHKLDIFHSGLVSIPFISWWNWIYNTGNVPNNMKTPSNPLADEIRQSCNIIAGLITPISTSQLSRFIDFGKELLKRILSMSGYIALLDGSLQNKGLLSSGTTENKIGDLLRNTIEDMYKLHVGFHKELTSSTETMPVLYNESIDGNEVLDAERVVKKTLNQLTNVIEESNDTNQYVGIIPADFNSAEPNGIKKIIAYIKDLEEKLAENSREYVQEYVFRKQDDSWCVRYKSDFHYIKDSKGMHHIHRLLESPLKTFHPLTLIALDNGLEIGPSIVDSGQQKFSDFNQSIPDYTIDDYKKYKECLMKMELELKTMTPGTKIYAEKEKRVKDFKKSIGSNFNRFGKTRPKDDPGEQARQAISHAISRSYKSIERYNPELVVHFTKYCGEGFARKYEPPAEEYPDWVL